MDHQQLVNYKSTSIKTLWPVTSSGRQTDSGLIYWPNHSGETWLSYQEEEGSKLTSQQGKMQLNAQATEGVE